MKRTSVKQIPPSTLRAHLAQSHAADPHPDADLLTAFAEDALLDHERANVLAHLAACPDCRAVVHTAAAAEPERESATLPERVAARHPRTEPLHAAMPALSAPPTAAPEPRPTRSRLRTWIPGFALAASLIVMAASTIVFYRALHPNFTPTQSAATIPAPQLPAPTTQPPINTAKKSIPAAAPLATPRRAHAHATPPVLQTEQARVAAAPPPPATPAAGVSSSVSLGDLSAQRASNTPAPAEQAQLQAELRENRSATAQAKAAPRPTASSTESVQVAPSPTFGALQTTHPVAGFIAAPTPRPHFRINSNGQLERSVQAGIWMPVSIASNAYFRVLSISGNDVWAGGDHLRLFHSTDSGLTWTEVQVPATADRTHAIVHIRIDTPQHLTIEDDRGSTWTTTDAGATWQ